MLNSVNNLQLNSIILFSCKKINKYMVVIDNILDVDKVFVCHYPKLELRKKKLETFFSSKNISVEWVEKFSPEEITEKYQELVGDFEYDKKITDDFYRVCYNLSLKNNDILQVQNKFKHKIDILNLPKNIGKEITIPELSLYLKHKYCLNQQVENNYESILILEDDVQLDDNFVVYFNKTMAEFKSSKSDILIMGETVQWDYEPKEYNRDKLIHFGEFQLTRCTHAIIYNIDCTKKIINDLYPINFQWDFKLNEIILRRKLNVSWSKPGVKQGNQKSSIQ